MSRQYARCTKAAIARKFWGAEMADPIPCDDCMDGETCAEYGACEARENVYAETPDWLRRRIQSDALRKAADALPAGLNSWHKFREFLRARAAEMGADDD